MFEVRIHGRGGQGVVTAAELLSVAAFEEGRHAQAFPSFGSERTGAPVVSFCRIDDRLIRNREPIGEPDGLIVQDPTLLHQVAVFDGLAADGYVVINSESSLVDIGLADLADRYRAERMLAVPATRLAREEFGRPLPNAVLLGGFVALTGIIGFAALESAIAQKFPRRLADGNIRAARRAHDHILAHITEPAHAQAG